MEAANYAEKAANPAASPGLIDSKSLGESVNSFERGLLSPAARPAGKPESPGGLCGFRLSRPQAENPGVTEGSFFGSENLFADARGLRA